jgi:hypothetical protein
VFAPRHLGGQHAQAARHAEMQQQRAATLELEQQVFGAAPRTQDAAAGDVARDLRDRRANAGAAHARRVHETMPDRARGAPRRGAWSRLQEARAFAGRKDPRRGSRSIGAYLIFVSLYATCLRTTGIVLLDVHLLRMKTLVLHRDVEVAGAGRGQQLDFFAHSRGCFVTREFAADRCSSDLRGLGAHLGDDGIDAVLFDGAHRVRGAHAQRDPALFAFEPETLRVQVRQEAAALLVVGVRTRLPTVGRLPVSSQTRDILEALENQSVSVAGCEGARDKGRSLYQRGRAPATLALGNRGLGRLPAQSRPRSARYGVRSISCGTWSYLKCGAGADDAEPSRPSGREGCT